MPWIESDGENNNSILSEDYIEEGEPYQCLAQLPMTIMRSRMTVTVLSNSANKISTPGFHGGQQTLPMKSSLREGLEPGTRPETKSKTEISSEELKKTIGGPYGYLHPVEVRPPVHGNEFGEKKRRIEPNPEVLRSPSIRPRKNIRQKNSYTPVESILTQPVSKRELMDKTYRNSVLAFKNMPSFRDLDISASQTLVRLDHRIKELNYLESAVLSVYLLRHRVMVVEGSKSLQSRAYALAAFGDHSAGKFCYPDGDLLMLPRFHRDVILSRTILAELQVAMRCIHDIQETYTPQWHRIMDPKTITPEVRALNLVGKEFPVEGTDPIDLFFKPVFTQLHYHMGNAKARLTVELLQAAIMVFINLTEQAFCNEDFGAALFLAQIIRRCTNCFTWILADEDLKKTYLFTMMEWYWARAYFNVGNHWTNQRDLMMYRYNETKKELDKFTDSCFGGMVLFTLAIQNDCTPSSPLQEFSFPESARESTMQCVEGYKMIAVDPSFLRSTFEKVSSTALNLHFTIMAWTDSVVLRTKGEHFVDNIAVIMDASKDIDYILNQRKNENNLAYFKILLYTLSAKCCRILAAHDDATALRERYGSPCLLGWMTYSETYLDKRSMRQFAALQLMIKVYQKEPQKQSRSVLIRMARQTFFDEVIYEVQKQITDPYRTSGLTAITRLLPYVLYVWFGFDVPTESGTLEEAIPEKEKKVFNQIMAMMFMGLAVIYCLRFRGEANDSDKSVHLNNAVYYHALSRPYLQRPSVARRILNAFSSTLELVEAGSIQYHKKRLPNGASRCCAVLLGYVVTLLPTLWEMCINHRVDYRTDEGDRSLLIHEIKYPINVTLLELGTIAEEAGLKIFDSISKYLNKDFGLTDSIDGKCVILRGDIDVIMPPKTIEFNPLGSDNLTYEQLYLVTPCHSVENLPPVTGSCGCSSPIKGCPVETYHYVDEKNYIPRDKFERKLFDEVYYNLPLADGSTMKNLDRVFLKLRKNIGDVLVKTISEVKLLQESHYREVKIASIGKNQSYNLTNVDQLLKDLTRTAGYLKFPEPLVLVVTRVLSSLDEIFHGKQTHAMLRGSF